ncbi:polysaccharide deacetylase 2 family uncharacterized protein YibQ [Sulfitobacter undariae]|uniref:Polysaccharide deacetylase 2 family uncharacterized protein YibQ n=1 Tax=Sulfitobacter undariae TaxID=1563671 RepID=A0A7W6E2Y5_9RHOB|nr:divergent polysaccharide deacetylase family protein [Sulfitobacter undariae]MBB3993816.1 polysaccharide deacetylase 2 family uncharacterized protein YibQ [Sulfitobacter undariae]
MAHGVLSGIGLGAVFSLSVAGVISVVVPMEPQPMPETEVAAPATKPVLAVPEPAVSEPVTSLSAQSGTNTSPAEVVPDVIENTDLPIESDAPIEPDMPIEADVPPEPETTALAPQLESDLGAGVAPAIVQQAPVTPPTADPVVAPTASTSAAAPVQDVTEADSVPQVPVATPRPETGDIGALTLPKPLPSSVTARIAEDAPVLPNPQALAPMMPDDSPDVAMPEPAEVVAPQEDLVPSAPEAAETPEAAPQTAAEETLEPKPVKPRVLPAPNSSSTETLGTSARPSIGTPAKTLIDRNTKTAQTQQAGSTPSSLGVSAENQPINLYAQPFSNPDDLPMMSIVLIDTGVDLDTNEIGLPALSSFPYPISFAVDVSLPDAAERVAQYRANGFEVLAMLNLPQGAQPSDAEVSMSVALSEMPEVIGVLEGTGEGVQGSREVADQVTRILKASGHGLVTQSKGLNSVPKLAVKQGVPAAPIFRDFDSEGQKPRVIRRFLDQAAFKAGQEGGVIMLGRLRPETIEALLVWGLADRAGSVALVPVSAVLLDQR